MHNRHSNFLRLLSNDLLGGFSKNLSFLALVLLSATITNCAPASAQQIASVNLGRNGLPPCNMDSFVYQAGAHKEDIYGDEGVHSKPPLQGFSKASRINAGITGQRDAGLTTGHGSYMPDAWGADESVQAPNGEWDLSGAGSSADYSGVNAASAGADQAGTKDDEAPAQVLGKISSAVQDITGSMPSLSLPGF